MLLLGHVMCYILSCRGGSAQITLDLCLHDGRFTHVARQLSACVTLGFLVGAD